MIYSPTAGPLRIGPAPCMTTCPFRSTSLHARPNVEVLYQHFALFSQSVFIALQRNCKYIFVFLVNLGRLADRMTPFPVERAPVPASQRRNTFHWTLEVHRDLFALHTVSSSTLCLGCRRSKGCVFHSMFPFVFYDIVDRLQSASFSTGDRSSVR